MALVPLPEDFGHLTGSERLAASRSLCVALERGDIVFFPRTPVQLSESDLSFLRAQRQSEAAYHKNVAYRPLEQRLTGYAGEDVSRMRDIMARFSESARSILTDVLVPYRFDLDFASFRPLQEQNRRAKLHARNDLLHIDSFPTRPTHGRRILRFFVNIHPAMDRVWKTGPAFPELAQRYARSSGLLAKAERGGVGQQLALIAGKIGIPVHLRPAYDRFMLAFHNWLKENIDFQSAPEHPRRQFPPMSSWIVFTDTLSHAVLSGQYALEQTVLVRRESLLSPEIAPVAIVEQLMHHAPSGAGAEPV
jgi:hypothetical protein